MQENLKTDKKYSQLWEYFLVYSASIPTHHQTLWIGSRDFLSEECRVFPSYTIEYCMDIVRGLDMYELSSVFFYSWETMEVLHEVFACFHHSLSLFPLPEEISMCTHRIEYLSECWLIVSREKTPWIPKGCTSDHKSIEIFQTSRMYHLSSPVLITHDIPIRYHRDMYMLFEFVYSCEISLSSECLLIRTPMYWDEIGSCIFESLDEVHEEVRIFPAESSFHRYWYLYSVAHLFDDPECCITIDHERWSVSTFDDFFRRTSHIYIDTSDTISFDDFRCFAEHDRIFSEYLYDEWIFALWVCEGFSLEVLWVDDTISWVKLWKYHRFRCNLFHYLTIWTVTVAIHRGKWWYWSTRCEFFPEVFVHVCCEKENWWLLSFWHKEESAGWVGQILRASVWH